MAKSLILEKNGSILIKDWVYDEEKDEGGWVTKEIPPDDKILSLLGYNVELEDGYTLRDYFRMVTYHDSLQALDLYFPSYIKAYEKSPDSGCFDEDMPTLQLIKMIHVIKWDNKPGEEDLEDEISDYIDMNGSNPDPKEASWGISFIPLPKMLDTPIILQNAIYFVEDYKIPPGDKRNYEKDTYKGYYSLWDFVCAIIYELSWYGTPKETEKKGEEIKESHRQVKSGEAELVSWEEVFDDKK